MFHRTAIIAFLALLGCTPSQRKAETDRRAEQPAPKGADDAVFDPGRLLEVSITMPDDAWLALRTKGRDASTLATECRQPAAKIYPYHRAQIGLDGASLGEVEVRKKGFLGSLSVLRPSLKVRLDSVVSGQRLLGAKRLTLNNNRQDAALMRTCLAYKVFRDAGYPAPRCNHARVTVNGTALGIYSNVEPIKKPFLRRHFGDDSGTLFEGQIADFQTAFLGNFEQKNEKTNGQDREALEKLTAALEGTSTDVRAALEPYLDVDEFLTFWALETLVGHWDGYTSNRNNFYLYRAPKDGKLHFVPWGADLSFTNTDPFHSPTRPATVSASSRIAARLYASPSTRAAYVKRLGELLETAWDEKALLAEVDRVDALLGGAADKEGVEQIKAFVTGRRKHLSSELAAGGGEWKEKPNNEPCHKRGAEITGTFETTFGSINAANPLAVGKASLSLTVDGKSITLSSLGVVAGRDKQSRNEPAVRFVGLSGTDIFGVQLFFEEPLFRTGETQPFQGFATWGLVFELRNMSEFKIRGFLGSGSIALEQASTTADAPVKGIFRGTLYEPPSDSQ